MAVNNELTEPDAYKRGIIKGGITFEVAMLATLVVPGVGRRKLEYHLQCPAEDMACYRVSKLVNNARHDSPACLLPG